MPPVTAASGPVAVTGASGYVGAAVVQNLVDHGYTVRACVRDLSKPVKTAHLTAMNRRAVPGRVDLFEADLLTPGSYDAVFKGCAAVFHVAAVLERDHVGGLAGSGRHAGDGTPQAIYDGGVVATRNVLESASRSGSVRRVIFTSSTAAVMHPAKEGYVHGEKDWGSDNQKKENWVIARQPYAMSKVEAEKMSYAWAERDGSFDVISHCPAHVLGPVMCKSHYEIWQLRIGKLVEGKPLDKFLWNITDTRDIAEAQRLSAESSVVTNGSRYCLVRNPDEPEQWVYEIQARLQRMYPQYDIAGESEKGKNRRFGCAHNGLMRKELGIVPYTVDETLKATVDSMIALDFIKPRLKAAKL